MGGQAYHRVTILKEIFLPWLVIRDLRDELRIRRELGAVRWRLQLKAEREAEDLRAQLSKFDHDGDGKPGGSKKR